MIEDDGSRVGREYFWFALMLIVVLLGSAARAQTHFSNADPERLSMPVSRF